MFHLEPARPRRRPDLTPMIDVVFLLLVFFMLVSRFSAETVLPLATHAPQPTAAPWQGPARLITLSAQGDIHLNGEMLRLDALVGWLEPLMVSADDPVILRVQDADLQLLTDTLEVLQNAGITRVIVTE